jgi:hypothetical protein
MSNIELQVLNEVETNTLQYLPYGVTPIEMTLTGDTKLLSGFIYPKNRTPEKSKLQFGYADDSQEILLIWGAGKHKGLCVNKQNAKGKLFLQLMDRSETKPENHRLSLRHTNQESILPLREILLVPAISQDASRMRINQNGNRYSITPTGSEMPKYYSRWFPSRTKTIEYRPVDTPQISIEFLANEKGGIKNIDSDIIIRLGNSVIAKVEGDWNYSWPHAELFTVFGDADYLVLRFWLYWLHGYYSTKPFLGGKALLDKIGRPKDEQTRRGWWEAADIEYPDIERFDFLIDTAKKKIIWVGTDFHYQEYWYEPRDEAVKAGIANDVRTIFEVLKKLKQRFNPPTEGYDPIDEVIKRIRGIEPSERLDFESTSEPRKFDMSRIDEDGNVTYRREGMLRKHVPFIKNATYDSKLVSNVVTG